VLWPAENLASRRLPKGAINSQGRGVFFKADFHLFVEPIRLRVSVARYDREHGQATRSNAPGDAAQTSTRGSGREAMRSDQRQKDITHSRESQD